jgi:hypothetical protein
MVCLPVKRLDSEATLSEAASMNSNAKTANARLPAPLLSQLDTRDAALWLTGPDIDLLDPKKATQLCKLPWHVVLSETSTAAFLAELDAPEDINSLLVRRRGLIHIVDTDPSEIFLPPRHLAVLLLNGRGSQRRTGMAAITRRLTMLADLRKRSIKQLVVTVSGRFEIPDDLNELWSDGFRTIVTFVSDDPGADQVIKEWRQSASAPLVDLIKLSPSDFAQLLTERFLEGREGGIVVRVRDQRGETTLVDVAPLDDPERPLLGHFELLGNELLTPLLPSDLTAREVDGFFADTSASWRPFAAGMVWERAPDAWDTLRSRLRNLDRRGPEENRILFVPAESGAGATTFLRQLAMKAAEAGYPTLIARRGLFAASALETINFLNRLVAAAGQTTPDDAPLYEAPCVLVFDQEHWSGRENDLVSFAREIERSGRRVCILMATGPYVGLGILAEQRFVELPQLTHEITFDQALALGRHLNRFLAPHGTARSEQEWRAFFESSSIQGGQGIAAFWIVLSFWLQRQIDLGETVQSRVYKQFASAKLSDELRTAILRIAAFSTVRTPLPDSLLPEGKDWPVAERLQDLRKELGSLGLIRVRAEHDRYWAMAHDLLGRYLLAGLFYDYVARDALGYGTAANPEHLRFLVLKEISALSSLQRADLRDVADSFAVSIFKIDPDHGHATLAPIWREVLDALDQMPRTARTTSRTFLHHAAISRRRIAADRDTFPMPNEERVMLLRRAVDDLEAAVRLDSDPSGETEINLFNSLAHAYHDLAEAEEDAGMDPATIAASRAAAHEATRRAFALNPDNSFVVETYARNLLSEARADENLVINNSLEVLNLVYAQMSRPASDTRRNALGRLSEHAFDLLLEHSRKLSGGIDPETETGAIAIALEALARGVDQIRGMQLTDYPKENRVTSSMLLAKPVLAGNVQAVKLRYMLAVLDDPLNFELHLELLEALQGSGPAFTPQMQLELAVLLFQQDRSHEGNRLFRQLRGLWRRGEHFVEVPTRLHWLLDAAHTNRRQVRASVAMSSEGRAFARVSEFQGVEVPFRATEFGQERLRPGSTISAYVSFGHNGPLLRPLTASNR